MDPSRRACLVRLAGFSGFSGLAAPAPAAAPAGVASPALEQPGVWDAVRDPAGFLVSEKYDGVRGHWDGATLRFRSGRPIAAPRWFTAALPRCALDGELWLGPRRFDELAATVRRAAPVDAQWRGVSYRVFDLPGAAGRYDARVRELARRVAAARWPALVAVAQTPVADRDALRRRLAATVARGGEGLVLHAAAAPHRGGRSDAVFKFKPQRDAEAVVVAHHPGRGRLAGRLGALEVRTPDGRRFLLGSGFSDAQRLDPPPLHSRVTYRYRDLTGHGLPRFASFLRVHDDAL